MLFGSQKEKVKFVQNLQSVTELELAHIKSSEIISGGFSTADQLEGAVFLQQDFRGAELAVVIVAHGMAVSAGIVDYQNITDVNGREAAVNGELVVVFAQATGDIVTSQSSPTWKSL